jgi:hypothetical protein
MMPANHQPPGVVPQYHQPSPMNQQQQNFASGAVVTQSQVQDRFSRHMTPQPTKICGDLLITLGVFMLVGQILEVIEFGIYTEYANSLVGYTGFWGGVIVSFDTYCYHNDHCRRHRHYRLYSCSKPM